MTPKFTCAPFMLTLTVVRIFPFVNGILKTSLSLPIFFLQQYILAHHIHLLTCPLYSHYN